MTTTIAREPHIRAWAATLRSVQENAAQIRADIIAELNELPIGHELKDADGNTFRRHPSGRWHCGIFHVSPARFAELL